MLKRKKRRFGTWAAQMSSPLIPGATKNIVYHWSSANQGWSAFYLRFPGTVQQDEGQV